MAGQSLGNLYTTLSLKTEGWVKSVNEAQQKLADFADEVEEVASKGAAALGDMSEGFLTVAAAAAGAFALGAQGSQPMKDALDKLEGTTRTLAVEFGKSLIPLVQNLTHMVAQGVTAWRSLSEEQKQLVVEGVKWAAIIGTVGVALGKAIVFLKSFAEGFVAVSKVATPVLTALEANFAGFATVVQVIAGTAVQALLPLLPVVLAVAAALLAVGAAAAVIYDAWTQSSTGLREAVVGFGASVAQVFSNIGTWIAQAATNAVGVLGRLFDVFSGYVKDVGMWMLSGIIDRVKQIAAYAANVARFLKKDDLAKSLDLAQGLTAESVVSTVGGALGKVVSDYKYAMGNVVTLMQDGAKATGDAILGAAKATAAVAKDMASTTGKSISRGAAAAYADSGAKGLVSGLGSALKGLIPSMPSLDWSGKGVGPTDTLDNIKKAGDAVAKADKEMADLVHQANLESAAEMAAQRKADIANASAAWNKMYQEEQDARKSAFEAAMGAQELLFHDILKEGERQRDLQKQLAEKVKAAQDYFTGMVSGRAGKITGVVESAMQGAAMGGPVGAAVGVGIDLLSQSEQFKEASAQLDTILQNVADALGGLLEFLGPLLGAVSLVVSGALDGLAPVFESLNRLLAPLTPVVALLGKLLAPLFQALGWALDLLIEPLTWLVNNVLRGLFEVLKGVALIILDIASALAGGWNAIIGGVQALLRYLGDIEIFDAHPFDFLNDLADSMEQAKISVDGIDKAANDLRKTTWEDMNRAAEERAEADTKAKEAADKLSDSLINGAKGWKVALARFGASDPREGAPDMPTPPGPGVSPTPSAPSSPGAPTPAPTAGGDVTIINVDAADPQQVADKIEAIMDKVDRRRGQRKVSERMAP